MNDELRGQRTRNPNFEPAERHLLIKLILEHKHAFTGVAKAEVKSNAWNQIHRDFNAQNKRKIYRPLDCLQKHFCNMKKQRNKMRRQQVSGEGTCSVTMLAPDSGDGSDSTQSTDAAQSTRTLEDVLFKSLDPTRSDDSANNASDDAKLDEKDNVILFKAESDAPRLAAIERNRTRNPNFNPSEKKQRLTKRSREPNFQTTEKQLIMTLVKRHKRVLLSRRTIGSVSTFAARKHAWKLIHRDFNAQTTRGVYRSPQSLRMFLKNVRHSVQKRHLAKDQANGGTGTQNDDSETDADVEALFKSLKATQTGQCSNNTSDNDGGTYANKVEVNQDECDGGLPVKQERLQDDFDDYCMDDENEQLDGLFTDKDAQVHINNDYNRSSCNATSDSGHTRRSQIRDPIRNSSTCQSGVPRDKNASCSLLAARKIELIEFQRKIMREDVIIRRMREKDEYELKKQREHQLHQLHLLRYQQERDEHELKMMNLKLELKLKQKKLNEQENGF